MVGKMKAVRKRNQTYRLERNGGMFDSNFPTKKEALSYYKRNKAFVDKNTF